MAHSQVAGLAVLWICLGSPIRERPIPKEGRLNKYVHLVNIRYRTDMLAISFQHDVGVCCFQFLAPMPMTVKWLNQIPGVLYDLEALPDLIHRFLPRERSILHAKYSIDLVCHVESVKIQAVSELAFLDLLDVSICSGVKDVIVGKRLLLDNTVGIAVKINDSWRRLLHLFGILLLLGLVFCFEEGFLRFLVN